jgi:hypothetical protein
VDARLTTLLCKTITVSKSQEVKPGSNLAQFYKQGYGSKSALSPTMMIIIV